MILIVLVSPIAFEFWDFAALRLCQLYGTNRTEFPLGQYPFYVLIETSGSNKEHDDEVSYSYLLILFTQLT